MAELNCKCKVCGKLFHLKASKILPTGNCCSQDCLWKDKERANRISMAQTGVNGYWYGKGHGRTPNATCIECGKQYYARPGQNSKYCSNACRNKSESYRDNLRIKNLGQNNPWYGKHFSKESQVIRGQQRKGERNVNWAGGVTPLHFKLRSSKEMNDWKIKVFSEDKSTCAYCGERNTRKLEAHHWTPLHRLVKYHNIKTIEEALKTPALWDVNNGITLCKTCHDIAHDKRTMRREKQWINTFNLKYSAFLIPRF